MTADCAQAALFLHERATLEGRPHEANGWLSVALGLCERSPEEIAAQAEPAEKARALFTCAITQVTSIAGANPFKAMSGSGLAAAFLAAAEAFAPDPDDRLYAEGRVFGGLPPAFGARVAKAILSFEMLRRRQASAGSPYYWIGRLQEARGEEDRAKEAFREALGKSDARTKLWTGEEYRRDARRLVPRSYGLVPSLATTPSAGFFGALTLFDDRAFDTARAGRVTAFASTGGELGLSVRLEDAELVRPVAVGLSAQWARRAEDFYGLGPDTVPGTFTRVRWERALAELTLSREFLPGLTLLVGWRLGYAFAQEGQAELQSSAALDPFRSFYSGPLAALGYDTRDRIPLPRRGTKASLSGYFPSPFAGSERSFRWVELEAEQHLTLGLRHGLGFRAAASLRDGDVPLAAYAKVGQSLSLPGMRLGRLQDRAAAGAAGEYRFTLSDSVTLAAFAIAATVAPTAGDLTRSHWSVGGGGAVLLHPMGPSALSRIEVSRFGGETVLLGSAGVTL